MMEKKINIIGLSIKVIVVSLIVVIVGCSKSDNSVSANSGGSPGANEVWMQGMAFNPATKTISSGTTITWTNKDNTTHTATSGVPNSPDGLFSSGNLNNGGTFSFKFSNTGTFKYYCLIHGSMMTATIIVQ